MIAEAKPHFKVFFQRQTVQSHLYDFFQGGAKRVKMIRGQTRTKDAALPILGFSGWSGSGKTTLIEKLIPALGEKGVRVAVIKHDVHGISEDETGKDSFRFKQAGAAACVLCGPSGPSLAEAIGSIVKAKGIDLILVEGFKTAPIPHIGVARAANKKDLPVPKDRFLAVIADCPPSRCPVPCFDPNDIDAITAFILNNMDSFRS